MSLVRATVIASLPFLMWAGSLWAMEEPTQPDEQPESPVSEINKNGKIAESSVKDESWRSVVERLSPGYWSASPLPLTGKAMYYNPGVMERVLAFRKKAKHVTECPDCIGYAAMLRAGDLNRRIWLRRPGMSTEGPFWVIDAADQSHIPMLQGKDWVVDVDYETAMRWRMAGPVPVEVLASPPPDRKAPVPPLRGHIP